MQYQFDDISSLSDFIDNLSNEQKLKAETLLPRDRDAAISQSYAYSQAAFIIRNAIFSDVAS